MKRNVRAIVHQYSGYWKMQTESFDPEPGRYVSCIKMRDTRMPKSLLSEACRAWDGRPVERQEEGERENDPNTSGRWKGDTKPAFTERKGRKQKEADEATKSDPRFSRMFETDREEGGRER